MDLDIVKVRGLSVERITYREAMDIVIKHHYLHRAGPCSVAYGLMLNGLIVGVVCYGTPSSAPLRRGVCGPSEKDNVIELTRLWVMDGMPKNSASFLIGNTIRLCPKEIVVSYADISVGHIGVVYQATNWIYTGLSAKRSNWVIRGEVEKHCQTIADKYTAAELKEKYGDDFILAQRPRKHRYVYFNAGRKRRKELMLKLKYKPKSYPKQV